MVRSPERPRSPQPASEAAGSAVEPQESTAKSDLPPSPTRSDKSSDSEGKPVRDKLKETRIDAQTTSDPVPSSDLPMDDAPNGMNTTTTKSGDQSTSESDSERGRLRRKRSREDFEDDQDGEKHPEKKERPAERHARKKSRDVTSPRDSDTEILTKPVKTSVPPIHENDGDETMTTVDEPVHLEDSTSKPATSSDPSAPKKEGGAVISPKNKRTREETDKADLVVASEVSKDTAASAELEEERTTKRPRDKSEPEPATATEESETKIPPRSGFANTSTASPFATLSPPPQTAKATEKPVDQTLDDKFKSSGFSSFSSSSASPFGGLGSTTSKSPFASATSGTKLTSFGSATTTSNSTGGGFAALGSSSGQSAFGGSSITPVGGKSVFGGALGSSAFGGLGGSKLGLPSFATPGQTAITGLSQKPAKSFGTQQKDVESNDGEGSEGDDSANEGSEEKDKDAGSKFPRTEVETGEEGETAIWVGRGKLYMMTKDGNDKRWQERGVGVMKFNVTDEEPTKARFVLRADGTHRLLLNAAIPKALTIGDPQGKPPADGRLFFNTPTAEGKVDMYLIRMKAEKAVELHGIVKATQETMS